ncbi:MAG TPA: ABC transporter permease [Candidatus Nanoarchaeia archaeon]|nr:ABC transporter permease [Candidatus Nanoarchaeia archaeon]
MNIYSLTKTALRSMTGNKVRTFLTLLGIVIGVTSIMIVFSAGQAVRGLLFAQISSFGTNIIETEIRVPTNKPKTNEGSNISSAISQAMGTQITTLTLDDMDKIDKLANVKDSYAAILGQNQISFADQRKTITLFGTTASFINIDQSKIDQGRFFTDAEDQALDKVVVIGAKVKTDLFGDSAAVGQQVKIGNLKYEVIGVMKPRGAAGSGLDFDSYVYLPLRTLQKRVLGINYVLYMVHELKDVNQADVTAAEITDILRESHHITPDIDPATGQAATNRDDFGITTMQEMVKTLSTVTNAMTILLLAIVAISLIVGGVGIMNIMYVIVSERTAEIGLRKAVGASYADIMGQFLTESALITLVASVIGIIIGVGISFLIAVGAQSQGIDWQFSLPYYSFIVAIAFSLLCGITFGLLPARKAARMDPIEALRNE